MDWQLSFTTHWTVWKLFDHGGVDCCSNMAHLSACQSFLLMGPSRGYLFSQVGLQVLFFATQWEEYYTGTLPHAYGKWLGVSEVSARSGFVCN